mgnify:CR=1 FL=1
MNTMRTYNDKEVHDMYLDWLNNFISTDKFREHYDLGMAETENILDRGRKVQEEINEYVEYTKTIEL